MGIYRNYLPADYCQLDGNAIPTAHCFLFLLQQQQLCALLGIKSTGNARQFSLVLIPVSLLCLLICALLSTLCQSKWCIRQNRVRALEEKCNQLWNETCNGRYFERVDSLPSRGGDFPNGQPVREWLYRPGVLQLTRQCKWQIATTVPHLINIS